MKTATFLLILFVNVSFIHGQNVPDRNEKEDASICFYRKKQFTGSGNRIEILINSISIGRLKAANRLIVKVRPEDTVIIAVHHKLLGTIYLNEKTIIPKKGEKYYVETNWDKIYDKERPSPLQIFGLSIFLILRDKEQAMKDFNDDKYFKDHLNNIKVLSTL